jgi:hypothetical protein
LTTEFVIFNAKDISTGPVYRRKLSTFVPPGVSGSYADGLSYEQPANVIRRFTAVNALEKKNWNQVNGGFSGLGLNLLAD